jgi:hypothetical protein
MTDEKLSPKGTAVPYFVAREQQKRDLVLKKKSQIVRAYERKREVA